MKKVTTRKLVLGREVVKVLGAELLHAFVQGGEDVRDPVNDNSLCLGACSSKCKPIEYDEI